MLSHSTLVYWKQQLLLYFLPGHITDHTSLFVDALNLQLINFLNVFNEQDFTCQNVNIYNIFKYIYIASQDNSRPILTWLIGVVNFSSASLMSSVRLRILRI